MARWRRDVAWRGRHTGASSVAQIARFRRCPPCHCRPARNGDGFILDVLASLSCTRRGVSHCPRPIDAGDARPEPSPTVGRAVARRQRAATNLADRAERTRRHRPRWRPSGSRTLIAGRYRCRQPPRDFSRHRARTSRWICRRGSRAQRRPIAGRRGGRACGARAQPVIETGQPTIDHPSSGDDIDRLAMNFRATNATSPIVVATLAQGVQQDARGGTSRIAGALPFMTIVLGRRHLDTTYALRRPLEGAVSVGRIDRGSSR